MLGVKDAVGRLGQDLRGNGKFALAYVVLGPLLLPLIFSPHGVEAYLRLVAVAMPPLIVWMAAERVALYRKLYWLLPADERRCRVSPGVIVLQPLAKLLLSIPAIALVLRFYGTGDIMWFGLPPFLLAEVLAVVAEWLLLDALRLQVGYYED